MCIRDRRAIAQIVGSVPQRTYQNDSGSFYPFLLQPSTASYDQHGDITTTFTQDIEGEYTFSLPENIVQESPIRLDTSGTGITIGPAVPTLMIDDQILAPVLPQKSFAFEVPHTGKLSLNDTVIDFVTSPNLPIRFADVQNTEELKHWDIRSTIDILSPSSPVKLFCNNTELLSKVKISDKTSECGSGKMVLEEDTVLDATMFVSASEPVQLSWCFSTAYRRECVQSRRFYSVFGKSQLLTIHVPTVLKKGDTVEMFLNFSPLNLGSTSDVEINRLSWHVLLSLIHISYHKDSYAGN